MNVMQIEAKTEKTEKSNKTKVTKVTYSENVVGYV
jgi:hypothetical protein